MTRRPSQRRRHYALREEPQMTLAEVGEALGVTPECARQIETNALRKLRAALEVNGFRCNDFFD